MKLPERKKPMNSLGLHHRSYNNVTPGAEDKSSLHSCSQETCREEKLTASLNSHNYLEPSNC